MIRRTASARPVGTVSCRPALLLFLTLNVLLALGAVAHGLLRTGNPSRYFGEGRWPMAVSCFQMLLVAGFALAVFFLRRRLPDVAKNKQHWLWGLIAAGFTFLAADDAFQIHERIDSNMHRWLDLNGTGVTDRIDDAVVGVYALIGLSVLFYFRGELLRFRPMLKPLFVGGGFTLLCIACDALSNRPDVFFWLTGDMAVSQQLEGWFAAGDGAFQLCAQGCFAAAFYLALRLAQSVDRASA